MYEVVSILVDTLRVNKSFSIIVAVWWAKLSYFWQSDDEESFVTIDNFSFTKSCMNQITENITPHAFMCINPSKPKLIC